MHQRRVVAHPRGDHLDDQQRAHHDKGQCEERGQEPVDDTHYRCAPVRLLDPRGRLEVGDQVADLDTDLADPQAGQLTDSLDDVGADCRGDGGD